MSNASEPPRAAQKTAQTTAAFSRELANGQPGADPTLTNAAKARRTNAGRGVMLPGVGSANVPSKHSMSATSLPPTWNAAAWTLPA